MNTADLPVVTASGRAWITVRFETSPALAGRTFEVFVARKTNGVWSAFAPHTSIVTNSSGIAYYQYRAGSGVWESFLVKYAGDSTTAPSSSSGTQARWL
jgi:hypothetical protein